MSQQPVQAPQALGRPNWRFYVQRVNGDACFAQARTEDTFAAQGNHAMPVALDICGKQPVQHCFRATLPQARDDMHHMQWIWIDVLVITHASTSWLFGCWTLAISPSH